MRAVKSRNAGSRNIKLISYIIKSGSLAEVVKANKSKSGKSTFLRRIKFSLDSREIEELIGNIDSASKRLRRLSKCAATVHDMRSASTKISKYTRFLHSIQMQADRLYAAVADNLSSCCHDEHDTKLLLNDRLEQFKTREKPTSFSLAIMSPSEAGSGSLLSHSVQIDVLEDETFGYVSGLDSERVRSNNKSDRTDHLHSRGRSVTFTSSHEEPLQNHAQVNRISNICQSLNNPQVKSKLRQLYLSQGDSLSYRLVTSSVATDSNPLSLRVDQRPEQFFTLKRVLLQSADLEASPNAKGWSRDQRMALSFKLASSLLQLCLTPWLMNAWTKEDICFMHAGSSRTSSKGPLQFEVRHPFIIAKIPERRSPDKRATKRQMLELGILLLEIWQETSLENWAASVGLTIRSSYGSRYDAARKWLSESETVSVSYWDAVDHCIECAFPALPDWQNTAFRKSVCERVVKPLCHNSSYLTDQETLDTME